MGGLLKIPEKHQVVICYIFIGLSVALIFFLAFLVFLLKDKWELFLPLSAMILIMVILGWFIRGGKISGKANRKGFAVTAEAEENRETDEFEKVEVKRVEV